MTTTEQIEIPLSKRKLTLMLMGSIVFIALGVWMQFKAMNPPIEGNMLFRNPTVLRTVGIASILFFGLCAFSLVKKLGDKSPGLVISNEGIFDNSSGVSAGLIPWPDILEIKEIKVVNQTFLNIIVKDPQEYIDRQKSAFKRKTMQINYNSYGTVIGISSNGLQYNYSELKKLLETKLAEHKS